jgi:hypothetical protein
MPDAKIKQGAVAHPGIQSPPVHFDQIAQDFQIEFSFFLTQHFKLMEKFGIGQSR